MNAASAEPVETAVLRPGREPSSSILDTEPEMAPMPGPGLAGTPLRPHETVGAYCIVREVGVGGMGVVYEAIDQRLKRRAAIKVIRGGVGVSPDTVRRFQTEAEAVAQAHHPNIVQIYDVGWHDGQPYVALEYLSGGSLYAKAGNKPQPPAEAAALLRVLADAMHQAHAGGVVHRDLKPANILFTADGTPKITDFGAARLTQTDTSAAALTQIGEVIGTPQYMAPEQARGTLGGAAPSVDVYALGAVLYHLLTGRPPHDGPDAFDALHAAVHSDPVAPRRLVPKIPRDLETICLKAMEKHPANRYLTAQAMADDLGRFLAGDSIQARPDPSIVRLWKKARRRPAIAGLAAGIVVVALAGIAGIAWQWRKALDNKQTAELKEALAVEAKSDADDSRERALTALTEASAARERAVERGQVAEAALKKATDEETRTRAATAEKEQNLYGSRISGTALMLENGDFRRAQELLKVSSVPTPGVPDLRHWEWHHLSRQASNFLWMTELTNVEKRIDLAWAHAFALSPDGQTLLVSGGNPYLVPNYDIQVPAQFFFLDAATGRVRAVWADALPQKAQELVWLDASTIAASTPEKGISVRHYPSGKLLRQWKNAGGGVNHESRLSVDGRIGWICTNDTTVAVLDIARGDTRHTLEIPAPVRTLPRTDQSAEQSRVTVGTADMLFVFDPVTGRKVLTAPGFPHRVAINRPATRLAYQGASTVSAPGFLACWDLSKPQRLWSLPRSVMTDESRVEFSPEGDTLCELFSGASFLKMHIAETGTLVAEFRGHTNRICDFHFSPDGRSLATASNDGSVRVWNRHDAIETARLRVHATGARVVRFDPRGWRLYSGGMDGYTIAWDLTRESPDGTRLPLTGPQLKSAGGAFSGGLWFGPDGLVRSLDTTFQQLSIIDPATSTPHGVVTFAEMPRRAERSISDFALSADARRLFGPAADGAPCLWDATTGKIVLKIPGFQGYVSAAAYSPDGTMIAGNTIKMFQDNRLHREWFIAKTTTGEILHRQVLQGYGYTALAFDAHNTAIYLGVTSAHSAERGIHRYDLVTKQMIKVDMSTPTAIHFLTLSPDGEWLAGIDQYQTGEGPKVFAMNLVDRGVGWRHYALGPAAGLAYSPDSRRIAVARYDDSITLHDARTGLEAFSKQVASSRQADYAFAARAAFSPDGRSLVVNHSSAQLSIWRTDDWFANPSERRADRRREAEAAAFAWHLRGMECSDASDRFHRRWLDTLTPPNDYVKQQRDQLRD